MNYRHAYHAGNFADVVKHALVSRLIEYLKLKEKPFRVYDTHAGRGMYDLSKDEAQRTGEYEAGIKRLLDDPHASSMALLQPYLQAVSDLNGGNALKRYPGSPLLARKLLRKQDRLSAYELHPVDFQALSQLFSGDHQVKAIELDGWLALGGHLPPKEKRGLVLIDPPFEVPDEITRIVEGLAKAHARWPGGIYAVWYPLKRRADREQLHALLKETGIPKIVAAEFLREPFHREERLVGTGLVVINPPYSFTDEAAAVQRQLESVLGVANQAQSSIVEISKELIKAKS